jgi:hypothetical protein
VAHADLILVEGGTTHPVRLDRGTVVAISSGSVTIAEADGSTVTIPVDENTKILRGGHEGSLSELHEGDTVFAVREGSGPARSLRAFDADLDPCARHFSGPGKPLPSPSPSST